MQHLLRFVIAWLRMARFLIVIAEFLAPLLRPIPVMHTAARLIRISALLRTSEHILL